MSDCEELYYYCRGKYNDAVENKTRQEIICSDCERDIARLSTDVDTLRAQKRESDRNIGLLEFAETKCRSILEQSFARMTAALSEASGEYRKIFSSDTSTADLSAIYSDDITCTKQDLEYILGELMNKKRTLQADSDDFQRQIDNNSSALEDARRNLSQARGEKNTYFRQEVHYRTEMEYYFKKWMAGC